MTTFIEATRPESPPSPSSDAPPLTYILPIRHAQPGDVEEMARYLRWLASHAEVIVVDGSPEEVFGRHAEAWPEVRHVAPDPILRCTNGKVWGVLTGLSLASNERIVIADDDVRYDDASLARVSSLLDEYDVVRPQNYFASLPWHARWDTARSLLNRAAGGDWPGTLGVRRSLLAATGGYDGECLFENLELVRTIVAAGGRECVARDLYVQRLPPAARHFLAQRVRQAYDEFARPPRLAWQLALLPAVIATVLRHRRMLAAGAFGSVLIAEIGRRRDGGARYFPLSASLFAPLWLLERGVCAWLALGVRVRYGGVRYSNGRVAKAASSPSELRARLRTKVTA